MSSLPAFTFGAVLRRHRLRAGLTQEALAARAQLSAEAISTLERGTRRAPRQATIDLLADALGLSPAERVHLRQVARGQSTAVAGQASRWRAAREIALPLVGRWQELSLLERYQAGEGPPLLLLAGEPGIGKSRLLAE